MTEKDVLKSIARSYDLKIKSSVMMPNCFIASDNEADMFCIQKNKICHEFEVKLSRQDFLKDKKKRIKYREVDVTLDVFHGNEYQRWVADGRIAGTEPWKMNKLECYRQGLGTPNYFWYVLGPDVKLTPDEISEITEFAGIYVVGNGLKMKQKAKKLHNRKIDDAFYINVLMKGCYRYLDLFSAGMD